jgi:hypothetical protein
MELKVQSARINRLLMNLSTLEIKIKSLEGISEVDFERFELAFKSSKLNYESAKKQLAQLKVQLKMTKSATISILSTVKIAKMIIVLKCFSGTIV